MAYTRFRAHVALVNTIALGAFVWLLSGGVSMIGQSIAPNPLGALQYRYIGPSGNRTAAVAGVPGDPLTYYVGSSSGGIFKSGDGGTAWEPIFDAQPAQSIGALAVAASDPNVVWAGTGEAFIRSNVSIGNGVYRWTDAGRTWTHMGLESAGRIGRVAIDPRDPDVVLVAAMGHNYGPQKERGVFRTEDGGKTWERILFAGMWPLVIHLFQPTIPVSDTKSSRDPQKVYEKLSVLSGDVGGNVDFASDTQQREVQAVLKSRLDAQQARVAELTRVDLAAFNRLLQEKGVAGVIVPAVK
jgi:photosystem II stability/assembly factor-like uncharacterized protein